MFHFDGVFSKLMFPVSGLLVLCQLPAFPGPCSILLSTQNYDLWSAYLGPGDQQRRKGRWGGAFFLAPALLGTALLAMAVFFALILCFGYSLAMTLVPRCHNPVFFSDTCNPL